MAGFVRGVIFVALGWALSRYSKKPARKATPEPKTTGLFPWNDERAFEWYMAKRTGYSNGARDSYSRYDQTIASVSAGAIVLSITFLKDIGYTAWSIPWLYASWIAFLVAGGASLFSLRTSADFDIEQLSDLEALRDGIVTKSEDRKATEYGKRTVMLNKYSLGFFVAGVFLAIMFALINYPVLGGKQWKAEKEARKTAPQRVEIHVLSAASPADQPTPTVPPTPSSTERVKRTVRHQSYPEPPSLPPTSPRRKTEEPNGN
ncbi:MAG: hypothetical protein QOJ98_2833 [Acidobacteriota bacterium]|jgi:hypothetical protein|nr:hypothetical protein [Acidobacteriota bacterium]